MSTFYLLSFTLIFWCLFAFAEDNPDDREGDDDEQRTAAQTDDDKQQGSHSHILTS